MTQPDVTQPDVPVSGVNVVAVVGGGPAGISAALSAAECGMGVCVIDGEPAPGGQIWRQPRGGGRVGARPRALRDVIAHPRIAVLNSATVWHAIADRNEIVLFCRTGAGQREIRARAVVLATGATELALPFPGWDLPGVVTPGGAQALLKADGVLVGSHVVVAGTGPLLWPVASALIRAGVSVAALVESAPVTGLAPMMAGLLAHPALARQAAGYLRTVLTARTRVLTHSAVIAAHGDDSITSVTVARLDGQGRPVLSQRRDFDVDAACVGWGFVPAIDLARQLGCAEAPHPTRPASAVSADADQRTSVPRVFAAGELTGIGGAVIAALEGTIAGAAAAESVGAIGRREFIQMTRASRIRLRWARHAARLLDEGPGLPALWSSWLDDDTVVCRCEEVTWGQVAEVIDEGIGDVRGIKGQTRCGMGWCQGRMCGPALQSATAIRGGRRAGDVGDLATRRFATPVTIADLAGFADGPPRNPQTHDPGRVRF